MSFMGPVNPRQNIPGTGGGYRPGRILGAVFGGLASLKQRRSMAQIQFDLHTANSNTDLENKKALETHKTALGDFTDTRKAQRDFRYTKKYGKQSIEHAINSTEALKNYAEANGMAKPNAIQPIVNLAGFNKFGPQFQNVGTVVHTRTEGPSQGGDPTKGGKGTKPGKAGAKGSNPTKPANPKPRKPRAPKPPKPGA